MIVEYSIELYCNYRKPVSPWEFTEISRVEYRDITPQHTLFLANIGYAPFVGQDLSKLTYNGEQITSILCDMSRGNIYLYIRTNGEKAMHSLMGKNTGETAAQWAAIKRASKLREIAKKQNTDENSSSGIQPWSRFTAESTRDFEQLGFIHGSNGLPFNRPRNVSLRSMAAYLIGYDKGTADHKPFGNV